MEEFFGRIVEPNISGRIEMIRENESNSLDSVLSRFTSKKSSPPSESFERTYFARSLKL